jgi:hypothetical protein
MTETKDQIKTKVLQWLNEEDRSPTELDDPSTELNIAVPIQENGSISVIFRREKKIRCILWHELVFHRWTNKPFPNFHQIEKNHSQMN